VASAPGLQSAGNNPKEIFRFVARQPILDGGQRVFGYELLFRDGIENFFRATDAEAAARSTLDSTQLIYNLMLAQESGDWGKAKASAAHLHIVESEAGEMWRQAMLRARNVSNENKRWCDADGWYTVRKAADYSEGRS